MTHNPDLLTNASLAFALAIMLGLAANDIALSTANEMIAPTLKKNAQELQRLKARDTLTRTARKAGYTGELECLASDGVRGTLLLHPKPNKLAVVMSLEVESRLAEQDAAEIARIEAFFLKHKKPEFTP